MDDESRRHLMILQMPVEGVALKEIQGSCSSSLVKFFGLAHAVLWSDIAVGR